MNIRKPKNEFEFIRDNEPVQSTYKLTTTNPTLQPRDIVAFTQASGSYRLFTRISVVGDDTDDHLFRIVRGNNVLYEALIEEAGVHQPIPISSPESIKLESGEEIKFQIQQKVATVHNFYLNIAWITFPN